MRRRKLLASVPPLGLTLVGGCTAGEGGNDPMGDGDAWLGGGTASVAEPWADPFAGQGAGACTAVQPQLCGPCHAPAPMRRDVTEGAPGIPMRLSLRVQTIDCEPIFGAEVEIWYCDVDGVYSGETPQAICQGDEEEARQETFHRGRQITDAAGRVDFDAVFPGWYGGRTTHVHLWVATREGEHFVSQLYFDDALVRDIYGLHPDYEHRGARDTDNGDDRIFDAEQPNVLMVEMTDERAMLAYADLMIIATADGAC